jgi:Nucleotidyltransferase of unknown function (DUF6036)
MDIPFYTKTQLGKALAEIFQQLEERLGLTQSINVYLAGGMAMHLYTGARVTTDVDAEFAARIHVPSDLLVDVTLEDGSKEVVYIDTNYSPTFALMHENYRASATLVDLGLSYMNVYVLSPVDLAVSKISRFAENDQEDIAELVMLGLTTAEDIEDRANDALIGYVGGISMLKCNLRDTLELARKIEAGKPKGSSMS